jgi:hypothetical protein
MNYRLNARPAGLGLVANPLGASPPPAACCQPPAAPEPTPREVLEEMIAAHRELAGDPEACLVIGGNSNFADAAQALLDQIDHLEKYFVQTRN